MKNNGIIKLTYYKNHLILTLLDSNSPKILNKGIGQSCLDFNSNNMLISKEALECLEHIIVKPKSSNYISLEFISKNNIWWASKTGGIIIDIECSTINLYEMPLFTKCDNTVDNKIIDFIDTKIKDE